MYGFIPPQQGVVVGGMCDVCLYLSRTPEMRLAWVAY